LIDVLAAAIGGGGAGIFAKLREKRIGSVEVQLAKGLVCGSVVTAGPSFGDGAAGMEGEEIHQVGEKGKAIAGFLAGSVVARKFQIWSADGAFMTPEQEDLWVRLNNRLEARGREER
jgi:hypothetical protein